MEALVDRYLISEKTSGGKRTKIFAVRKHDERGAYLETVTETLDKDGTVKDSKTKTTYYPGAHISTRKVDCKLFHEFIE